MTLINIDHRPVKSRLVLPFWYRLTRVVPGKGPLNGCICYLLTYLLTTHSNTPLLLAVQRSSDGSAGKRQVRGVSPLQSLYREPVSHCRGADKSTYLLTYLLTKGSPYSVTERRVPELLPVLGSQPASYVSHKPDGRLPLLSASLQLPPQP